MHSSHGIKNIHLTILVIIFSILMLVPGGMKPQEVRYNEFNEKGMESKLRYGENIKDDREWRDYSQGVKTKMEGEWEPSALQDMMTKLGLTLEEARTNGMYLQSRADWEVKADKKIEEMYGKWRVKKDWDYQIKGGEIRQFIIESVWSKKDDISNIYANIEEMLKRVETNWGAYLDLYEAGLSSYLDVLTSGTGTGTGALSEAARINYIEGIEETSRAQVKAASGLAGQFIKLEEDKYYKYMSRMLRYQSIISSNDLIFNELSNATAMGLEISNVLSGASNLESPLSAALEQIALVQSNVTLIAEGLAVPYTEEEDLSVGIRNWEDMVRDAYRSGLDEWNGALSNLMVKMNDWETSAMTGHTNGWDEWQRALYVMNEARWGWQSNIQSKLEMGMSVWSSNIGGAQGAMLESLEALQSEIERTGNSYEEYSGGMLNIFMEGSSTLKTINENLGWINEKLPQNITNKLRSYNEMTSVYAQYNYSSNKLSVLTNGLSLLNEAIGLYFNTITSSYVNTTYNYKGCTVTVYYYKPYMYTSGSGSSVHTTGSVTVNYGGQGFCYTLNSTTYYDPAGRPGSTTTTTSKYCTGSYGTQDIPGSISQAYIILTNSIAQTNKYVQNYAEYSADLTVLSNELLRWTGMQASYTTLMNNSKTKLLNELYSGELGTGVLSNSGGEGVDLYFRSQKEMDYASKQEELKYWQERLEISRAVMEYALSDEGAGYAGLESRISNASGTLNEAIAAYAASTNALCEAQRAAEVASKSAASNSLPLLEAKGKIDEAMRAYEEAKKEYEKQAEILALLEEGVSNVQSQARTFIDRAVQGYIASLTDYNNARNDYYGLYAEKTLEELAKNYYIQLTNLGVTSQDAQRDASACQALSESVDLPALTNSVDNITALLVLGSTNSGCYYGARGRLYSISEISNRYSEFYSKALSYLRTGEMSNLESYTSASPLNLETRRTSYTGFVMDWASNFVEYVELTHSGEAVNDITAELHNWEVTVNFSDLKSGLDPASVMNILEGVRRYIEGNTALMNSLTNTVWDSGLPRQSAVYDNMKDWELSRSFLESGGTDLDSAHNFLASRGLTGALISTEEYNRYLGLLLGGGEFGSVFSYYDGCISDIDSEYNDSTGYFNGLSSQLLSWGKVFFGLKDGGNIALDIGGLSTTEEVKDTVYSLTNLKGLYGEAMDAYIDELTAKLRAAEMIKTGSYASETNAQNSLYARITNKMMRADALNTLFTNGDVLSAGYIDAAYTAASDASEREKLRKTLEYLVLEKLDYGTVCTGEAGLLSYLESETSDILGGKPAAGLTLAQIAGDILNEASKRYIAHRIDSLVLDGAAAGFSTTEFTGFGAEFLDFAANLEDVEFYRIKGTDSGSSSVTNYKNLVNIQNLFNEDRTALSTEDKSSRYYTILEASEDYRVYLTLNESEKSIIDTGRYSALEYYGFTLLEGTPSFEKEYAGYESLLNTLKQGWSAELSGLNTGIPDDQAQYSSRQSGFAYYEKVLAQAFFKQNETELLDIENASSNFTAGMDTEFDSIESNRLVVRQSPDNDGYAEVRRMLIGLTNLTSAYNAGHTGFTALSGKASDAFALSTNTFNISDYGLEAYGSLLEQYSGQYEGSFAAWNGAAQEMLVWAMALSEAGSGQTNYMASPDYRNAAGKYETENSNVRAAQDAYYAKLDVYNGSLSNYYDKLSEVSRLDTSAKEAGLEKRKAAAVLSYAMLPELLGVETNSPGATAVTNAIDPVSEYNHYLAICLSNTTELSNLGRDILSERTLKASIRAKLDAYANDFSAYRDLLDSEEILGNKEGISYQMMMEAKEAYETEAGFLLGPTWTNSAADPTYSAFCERLCKGELSALDIHNLLQWEMAGSYSQSQANLLNDLSKYKGTKYEELYRLMFGIRTSDFITNSMGSELNAWNTLASSNPSITLRYYKITPVYRTNYMAAPTLLYNITNVLTQTVNLSRLTLGNEVNVINLVNSLDGALGYLNNTNYYINAKDYQNFRTTAQALRDKLNSESSYVDISRSYFPPITFLWWTLYPGAYTANDSARTVDTNNRGIDSLFQTYIDYNNANSSAAANWVNYYFPGVITADGSKTGPYNSYFNSWSQSVPNVQTLRIKYDTANSMSMKYTIDVSRYTNESGAIDSAKLDNAFFSLVCGNISAITVGSKNITGLSNIFNTQKEYIARYLSAPGSVSDGKIAARLVLEAFEKASDIRLAAQESDIRTNSALDDSEGKLYVEMMLSQVLTNAVFSVSDMTSESFRRTVQKTSELKNEAFMKTKNQEAALQQEKWNNILSDLYFQMNDEGRMWNNILITGSLHWDNAMNAFTNAMVKWDIDYRTAMSNGRTQWNSKINILTNRREQWLNLSAEVVSNGSSEYISDVFRDGMDDTTYALINDDLPDDIAKNIAQRARELQGELMPKNNTAYLDFFSSMIGQARESDVKFVMDGISRFTGDSQAMREFNLEMRSFKDAELNFSAARMKQNFRDQIKKITDNMNKQIVLNDRSVRDKQFAPMIIAQGFSRDGNDWVKRNVIVDSTVWGDQREDLAFQDYQSYTNRMNYDEFSAPDVLDKIQGRQAKFDLLLEMQSQLAQKSFDALMTGFDKYIGTNSYEASGNPETYKGVQSDKGETYRLTWALSYYGYLESVGKEKANTAIWDKPLWDSDANNDGQKDTFSVSIFDVTRVAASVVMSVTGVGAIAAAAINAGIALAHDGLNLATGHMNINQFGLAALKDIIGGATGMLAGVDAGNWVFNAGVNSLGNLASTGLKLDDNGNLGWGMDSKQWSSWAMGSLASFGSGYLNNVAKVGQTVGGWTSGAFGGNQSWLGNAMGFGMQKATEGFISSSLSTLGQSFNVFTGESYGFDWGGVARQTAMAGVGGFTAGSVAYGLGGVYDNGGLNFYDRNLSAALGQNTSLFYSDKLSQFANTIGSIAGEGLDYLMGNSFDVDLGGGVGIGFGHSGIVRSDGEGGVGLNDIIQSAGNLNYVGFQAGNAWSDQGLSRISYANVNYLTGLDYNKGLAMDFINGSKNIQFSGDYDGVNSFGSAGKDNRTIYMSDDAILNTGDANLREKLAFYTGVAAHEGTHLDQHAYMNANGYNSSGEFLERGAYYNQLNTYDALQKNLGLSVGGGVYGNLVSRAGNFLRTGDPSGLSMDGRSEYILRADRSLKWVNNGKYDLRSDKLASYWNKDKGRNEYFNNWDINGNNTPDQVPSLFDYLGMSMDGRFLMRGVDGSQAGTLARALHISESAAMDLLDTMQVDSSTGKLISGKDQINLTAEQFKSLQRSMFFDRLGRTQDIPYGDNQFINQGEPAWVDGLVAGIGAFNNKFLGAMKPYGDAVSYTLGGIDSGVRALSGNNVDLVSLSMFADQTAMSMGWPGGLSGVIDYTLNASRAYLSARAINVFDGAASSGGFSYTFDIGKGGDLTGVPTGGFSKGSWADNIAMDGVGELNQWNSGYQSDFLAVLKNDAPFGKSINLTTPDQRINYLMNTYSPDYINKIKNDGFFIDSPFIQNGAMYDLNGNYIPILAKGEDMPFANCGDFCQVYSWEEETSYLRIQGQVIDLSAYDDKIKSVIESFGIQPQKVKRVIPKIEIQADETWKILTTDDKGSWLETSDPAKAKMVYFYNPDNFIKDYHFAKIVANKGFTDPDKFTCISKLGGGGSAPLALSTLGDLKLHYGSHYRYFTR